MGLRPAHARMKIQSLPLTRGRLGGGCLLFSQQITEMESRVQKSFFRSLLAIVERRHATVRTGAITAMCPQELLWVLGDYLFD